MRNTSEDYFYNMAAFFACIENASNTAADSISGLQTLVFKRRLDHCSILGWGDALSVSQNEHKELIHDRCIKLRRDLHSHPAEMAGVRSTFWETLYIFPSSFGIGLLNLLQFVRRLAAVERP